MNENSFICDDCWLGEAGECPPGQTCTAYALIMGIKELANEEPEVHPTIESQEKAYEEQQKEKEDE